MRLLDKIFQIVDAHVILPRAKQTSSASFSQARSEKLPESLGDQQSGPSQPPSPRNKLTPAPRTERLDEQSKVLIYPSGLMLLISAQGLVTEADESKREAILKKLSISPL